MSSPKRFQIKVSDLPQDSLLRLRPVRDALRDPYFSCTCRPIDCNWNYEGFTDVMSGYNPVLHTHFYPATAALRRWLKDPINLGRELNNEDRLVKEVLMMTHDYIHSWAYRAIENIDPGLGINEKPITRQNLDEFAYIHLLTEAAAVVGLDYWYLCVKDVSQRCNLGSLIGPRTVEYQEQLVSEYRRFNPALVVQTPSFFFEIVKLFCRDTIEGFSVYDVRRSPALYCWLKRELQASLSQRVITRLWLSRLGGFHLADTDLRRPLPAPSRKQKQLAEELGKLLWKKIKLGASFFLPPKNPAHPWKYRSQSVDFRFTNLRRTAPQTYDWTSLPHPKENFSFYVKQYISQYRYPANQTPEAREELQLELETIQRTFDQRRLRKITSGFVQVLPRQSDPAPLEMIFLN